MKTRFRLNSVWMFVLLFTGSFVVYAPALGGEFIWDDLLLVGENPLFKSPVFFFEVFRHTLFFPGFQTSYYRPVQNLSYMLDYWLWNRNAFGYHLSNVLLHAGCAFFLFRLLKKILPALLVPRAAAEPSPEPQPIENATAFAAVVAFVWVIHPIHSAAVAYVAGRADSLAALFALAAWLLWIRTDSPVFFKKALPSGIAATALVLLALCSKEISLVWIALFLAHLFFFERSRTAKAKAAACCALALVLVCYWFLRHLPGKGTVVGGMPSLPLDVRLLLALRALGDYIWLLFFPLRLQMERGLYNAGAYATAAAWRENIRLEYLAPIGFCGLLIAIWACCKKSAGRRLRLFGTAWFFIGFLPVSNLFPLNAQAAEHWIYMPSIGFLVFLAGCWVDLPKKIRPWLIAPLCAAVLLLGYRAWLRSADWETAEIFYTRTIEAGGGSCRIRLNLADALARRNDLPGAEKLLRDTVKRFPGETITRIYLGRHLMREGKNAEAAQYLSFDKAASDRISHEFPKTWKAAQSLATIRQAEGKTDEALAIIDEALARYGDVWELVALKAQLVIKKEGDRAGIAILKPFADAHWWHYGSYLVLARLEQRAGDAEAALAALRHAAILDIHAPEPYSTAAQIELDRNQPQAALELQERALRRDPSDLNQLYLMSRILRNLGRTQEALVLLKKMQEHAE